jgi:hypothetical protein
MCDMGVNVIGPHQAKCLFELLFSKYIVFDHDYCKMKCLILSSLVYCGIMQVTLFSVADPFAHSRIQYIQTGAILTICRGYRIFDFYLFSVPTIKVMISMCTHTINVYSSNIFYSNYKGRWTLLPLPR